MTDSLFRRAKYVRRAAACLGAAAALIPFGSLTQSYAAAAVYTTGQPADKAASVPQAATASTVAPAAPEAPPMILSRSESAPMGKNNGVRLWVRGDGASGVLQVRLVQGDSTSSASGPAPTWISAPVSLAFTGWKEVVLPKSKFTLRARPADRVNTSLPALAQGGEETAASVAMWDRIDSIGLALRVPKRASIIVDDLAWVTLDAQSAVVSATVVDDFEKGNVAAWTSTGSPDQQQYLTDSLVTAPSDVHGGRVAFKLDAVSPAYIRETTELPAVRKALAAAHKTYLLYVPASRFGRILPTSLPSAGEMTSLLNIQACPEQIQAATFCVYSQKGLQDVTVALPKPLQAIGHFFAPSNIDVNVVKVWNQDGAGPLRDQDSAGLVPELLVKDDRVPLSGLSPAIRLTGAPVTDIPADTTKQFWITVSVPRGTPAGHYTGSLIVSGRGLPAPVPVRLDLEVLPIRLLSAAKQYGIDLRSRLDPAPDILPSPDGHVLATDFVSKETLDQQLADITAHGFRISTLYDSPATVWDAVDEYKKYGMMEPYIYKGDGAPLAVEAARKSHNAPSFVYYANPDPLTQTADQLTALTQGGLSCTTFITTPAAYDTLQSHLDLPVYNRDSPYAQQLVRTDGKRISSKRDWWYWTATDENPVTNRLDCGYLLWRANLYGAFLPAYQEAFSDNPYDDTSQGAPLSLAAYRPEMLTYPVQGGVLDTLQWEAAREGITDVRYLTTMYSAYRECKDAKIAQPTTDAAEAYVKAFLNKPLAQLPDSELDAARAKIAAYAVILRTTVDKYNKTHKTVQ